MNNKKYTELVENKQYPDEPNVPLGTSFIDDRGQIQNLLFTNFVREKSDEQKCVRVGIQTLLA
jgi:hypothetical protein